MFKSVPITQRFSLMLDPLQMMRPRICFLAFVLLVNINAAAQLPQPNVVPDAPAKRLSGPFFQLSPEEEAAGIDGKVKIAFEIDETGQTKNVVAVAGPEWPCGKMPIKEIEQLFKDLTANVEASKFSPTIKHGKPVSSYMEITYTVGESYRQLIEQKKREKEAASQKAAGIDPKPDNVEGGVVNGKAVDLIKPGYPVEARQKRVQGTVEIKVLIDETGKVIKAGSVSGSPYLQAVSREAACMSKFSPTRLSGRPVKVTGLIVYNFKAE